MILAVVATQRAASLRARAIDNVIDMPDHRRYHTHYRSRRLAAWDYAHPAAYFVTICVLDRVCLFGEVERGRMYLNACGRIAAEEWRRSETRRDEVYLDAFVVMPNHVHGIVVLAPPGTDRHAAIDPRGYDVAGIDVATQHAASLLQVDRGGCVNVKPKSLGAFVRAFKSAVTRRINRRHGTPGQRLWQPNYHDRILRNDRAWRAARQYVEQNPARWTSDANHPTRL